DAAPGGVLGIESGRQIEVADAVALRLGLRQGAQRDGGLARGRHPKQLGDPPTREAADTQRHIQIGKTRRDDRDSLCGSLAEDAQGMRAPAPLDGGNELLQCGRMVALHRYLVARRTCQLNSLVQPPAGMIHEQMCGTLSYSRSPNL